MIASTPNAITFPTLAPVLPLLLGDPSTTNMICFGRESTTVTMYLYESRQYPQKWQMCSEDRRTYSQNVIPVEAKSGFARSVTGTISTLSCQDEVPMPHEAE